MRYVFEGYLLDTQRYELSCRGKAIKLRPNVFEVLDYLIRHRDRVVSKDELLEHLWPQQFIADGTLNACLMAVRKAIGDSGQTQRRIKTLHGRGYRFVAAVEEQELQLPGGTTRTAEYAAPGAAGQTPEQGALLAVPEPPPTTHETPSAPPFPREASSSPALHILDQEHKLVTVLCCGLTEAAALATRLGAEAMHHRMQAFLARVQTTVERYGGTMIQYGVDGFMALFGAPMAHEDRARRAVLAARALQQELLRQRCHITDTDVPDTIRSKVYAAVQEAIIGSEEDIALLLQLLDVPVENSSLAHDTPNVQLQTAELLSEVSSLPAGVYAFKHALLLCRDVQGMYELTDAVVLGAAKQGLQICRLTGMVLQGWALAQAGHDETGIAQIQQALTECRIQGVGVSLPRYCALLAEAYQGLGRITRARCTHGGPGVHQAEWRACLCGRALSAARRALADPGR